MCCPAPARLLRRLGADGALVTSSCPCANCSDGPCNEAVALQRLGWVVLFCFVIFETCVSGLLGRVRIFFQDPCYRSLGVTAPVWCDVYLCVSALEQKDGEAGD